MFRLDERLARVEVKVRERGNRESAPPQAQPTSPHQMTEQGCAQAKRTAARRHRLMLGQVLTQTSQLAAEGRLVRCADPI